MVLAYFMCKMALDDRIDHEYFCDNYIYNYREVRQIPVFKAYDITIKLDMIYTDIAKYSDHLFSNKYQRLLAKNLPRDPKTAAKQTCIYKETLNNFALKTWPNNGLASLKFLIT